MGETSLDELLDGGMRERDVVGRPLGAEAREVTHVLGLIISIRLIPVGIT